MGRQNFVETDDNRIEVTTNYLCKILGVSDTTIAVWVRNGCPKLRKGWFDVGAVVRWKMNQTGANDGSDAEKLEAEIRYKKAKAAISEQELAVRNSELIPTALVAQRLNETMQNLKGAMLGIGDHLMMEIYSQYPELAVQARSMVDAYIRNALREYVDNRKWTEPEPKRKQAGRPRKSNK